MHQQKSAARLELQVGVAALAHTCMLQNLVSSHVLAEVAAILSDPGSDANNEHLVRLANDLVTIAARALPQQL